MTPEIEKAFEKWWKENEESIMKEAMPIIEKHMTDLMLYGEAVTVFSDPISNKEKVDGDI